MFRQCGKAEEHAMVMDAEMLTVAMSLDQGKATVALDSQGAITRLVQLFTELLKSWIKQRLQNVLAAQAAKLMCVKVNTGIERNEEADRRANIAAYGGRVAARRNRVIAAGIRQELLVHTKPKHEVVEAGVKGLVYMVTDRGPLRYWLK